MRGNKFFSDLEKWGWPNRSCKSLGLGDAKQDTCKLDPKWYKPPDSYTSPIHLPEPRSSTSMSSFFLCGYHDRGFHRFMNFFDLRHWNSKEMCSQTSWPINRCVEHKGSLPYSICQLSSWSHPKTPPPRTSLILQSTKDWVLVMKNTMSCSVYLSDASLLAHS